MLVCVTDTQIENKKCFYCYFIKNSWSNRYEGGREGGFNLSLYMIAIIITTLMGHEFVCSFTCFTSPWYIFLEYQLLVFGWPDDNFY